LAALEKYFAPMPHLALPRQPQRTQQAAAYDDRRAWIPLSFDRSFFSRVTRFQGRMQNTPLRLLDAAENTRRENGD
jgi:hypothetical protein